MSSTNLRNVTAVILVFCWAGPLKAEPQSDSSILLPPQNRELYERPFEELSSAQVRKIRVHGLRNAALHPDFWSPLKVDRTINRVITPMRRFYLRHSEDPNFRLHEIWARFAFASVTEEQMEEKPHARDPVLDIGFAEEFVPGAFNRPEPKVDRGYVLRLSAFPQLHSGIYYRSRETLRLVAPAQVRTLQSGTEYQLRAFFRDSSVTVMLNDSPLVSYSEAGLKRGLISLTTGWRPLQMEELSVAGSIDQTQRELSGLIVSRAINRRGQKARSNENAR